MDLAALRWATDLGGVLLSGPTAAHALVLAERIQAHGWPSLLVSGRTPEDLRAPLAAAARTASRINVIGILPTRETCLDLALAYHRVRIGSLVGAVDAGQPWLGGRPMMAKRMPGRLRSAHPLPLDPAPLRPLEKGDLVAQLVDSSETRLENTFLRPDWIPNGTHFQVPWWPGVAKPAAAEILSPSLTLPSHTPFTEALRAALRAGTQGPVPWLPHPGEPATLQALARLTAEIALFRGSEDTWAEALGRLGVLPAPPHFCARC